MCFFTSFLGVFLDWGFFRANPDFLNYLYSFRSERTVDGYHPIHEETTQGAAGVVVVYHVTIVTIGHGLIPDIILLDIQAGRISGPGYKPDAPKLALLSAAVSKRKLSRSWFY